MAGVGFTDFYDAQTARQIAMGGGSPLSVILSEINFIKTNIDTAAAAGGLSLTVTAATTMTNGTVYFEAWSDATTFQDDPHNLARARMDAVIAYFQRLGYAVKRQQNSTFNQIIWVIKW